MAGWGLGFWLLGKTASKIQEHIDDKKSMETPRGTLKDGTPIYYDSKLNMYANGEKIVKEMAFDPKGNMYYQDIGERSRKVYNDPYVNKMTEFDPINNGNKQQAISSGKLAYDKYDVTHRRYLVCEISTGRYISELIGREDGTYWKVYIAPGKGSWVEKDKIIGEVQITQEEYDKLNVSPGMGYYRALDEYRYNCKYNSKYGYWTQTPKTKVQMEETDRKIREKQMQQ